MLAACALALALLVDVSSSVSDQSYQLQQKGIADAFRDPNLQQIISSQPNGIAVTVIEWANAQVTTVSWMMIRTPADSNRFADAVMSTRRSGSGQTPLGEAMRAGIAAFDNAPCDPERKVMDVSGDGRSNQGVRPEDGPRDEAIQNLITVNGLPIVTGSESDIVEYYRENVITPDGFVKVAGGFEDFGRAIRQKLALEIASR